MLLCHCCALRQRTVPIPFVHSSLIRVFAKAHYESNNRKPATIGANADSMFEPQIFMKIPTRSRIPIEQLSEK